MPHVPLGKLKNLFLSVVSAACIIFAGCGDVYAAVAGPAAGCDPVVMDAMRAKGQAKVAYDVAATEQIIDKPDSVLALTCFNQAAGVSADRGGQIFSGDMRPQLAPIIETALQNNFDDFAGASGYDSPTTNYMYQAPASTLSNTFNCNAMADLWTRSKNEGVEMQVPYVSQDELIAGTPPAGPAATSDFIRNWNAATTQGIFTGLASAVAALPVPAVPNFSTAVSSCDVLVAAGTIPGPCP